VICGKMECFEQRTCVTSAYLETLRLANTDVRRCVFMDSDKYTVRAAVNSNCCSIFELEANKCLQH